MATLPFIRCLFDFFHKRCIILIERRHLGRAFMGWKWKNIPGWMHRRYQKQRAKFLCWDEIKYVLLDGHPTKKQLEAVLGKRGHPVSKHNVWCDEACRQAGEAFLRNIGRNIPSMIEEDAYATN